MNQEKESWKTFVIYIVVAIIALLFLKVILRLFGFDLEVPIFDPYLEFVIGLFRRWADFTGGMVK